MRGFDSIRTVTTQATLFPDGSVEMKYSDAINLGDAVVGISPGHTADVALVDLSTSTASSAGAIAERFAQASTIDTFAVAKKFYASHPDNYDQILLWTDQPLIQDAFAYELTVANEIRGIGQDIYDLSRSLGSGGRLRSLVVMDWLGKYPEDPASKFLGENNTLSVLGQEVGHRWLAYMDFRDRTGRAFRRAARARPRALELLLRFRRVGDGRQRHRGSGRRAVPDRGRGQALQPARSVRDGSRADVAGAGLLLRRESGGHDADARISAVGGRVFHRHQARSADRGRRRGDGARVPSVADSSKTHRQAFIYVVSNGRSLDSGQVAKLDRIRREWETFFRQATESRMTADTRLR